ncbi:MAG: CFI-box-CTERM domain-containing protein, partial [Polyangia bacterium]|nr:CFI-box-CTERM domain-containing protein [Polyangia bacterium]
LTARCSEESGGSTTLYVIVGDRNNDESGSTALSFDTRGEDTPTDVSASGGEGSVTVSWTAPTDNSNILYYDVLCSQDGSPIPGVSSEDKADWISSREICNKELFVGDATDVAEAPDCSIEDSGLNAGTHPSPCYVCYSAPSGTDRVRLSGLDNGTEYAFAVVSVDRHGNVSRVSEVVTATPEETTDFAEHYRDSGGREEGGFCFVATAVYGDYGHPDVVRLRGFRDRILMRSGPGRRFVAWYYRNGRAVALLQDVFPGLGLVARLGLEGLGVLVEPAGPGSRAPEGSAPMGLLLMVATAALARRRRQASRVVQDEASSPGTISVEEVRR